MDIYAQAVCSLLERPTACIKEIIHLGLILWKRSFRLDTVLEIGE